MLGRLATLSSSLLPPTIRRQVTPVVAEVTRLVKWGGPLVIIGNIHLLLIIHFHSNHYSLLHSFSIGAWMMYPAIPDKVRKEFGLPLAQPEIHDIPKFAFEDIDTIPKKR